MSMFRPEDELDHFAEFADSASAASNARARSSGSPGSYGFKRWLYRRWGNRGNAVYTFVGALLLVIVASGLLPSPARCPTSSSACSS